MSLDKATAPGADSLKPQDEPVELPRFMGRHIPPIDRLLIRVIPPVLIVAVMIWVLGNPEAASAAISLHGRGRITAKAR
jgi:choline/glycine/proline betaine transport protein